VRRLRILVLSLCVTALVLVARYVAHDVLGMTSSLVWDDMQVITTGAAVITGLMLAGVLREYGDAQQLPTQVASSLATLDRLIRNTAELASYDASRQTAAVLRLTNLIADWLYSKEPDVEISAAIDELRAMMVNVERAGASEVYLGRMHIELSVIDAGVDRMMAIRNSLYLQSGYTLMYVLTGIVIVLLIVVDFGRAGLAPWLMSGSLTMIYAYLILLVRDLDNPFSYGRRAGAAEVDLSGLRMVSDELRSRG